MASDISFHQSLSFVGSKFSFPLFQTHYGALPNNFNLNFICKIFATTTSRGMPSHIRECNRLEPHSSHDLVFKIWLNNKTEATFGVFFVSDCELLENKSQWVPPEYLYQETSNSRSYLRLMPAYRISLGFSR